MAAAGKVLEDEGDSREGGRGTAGGGGGTTSCVFDEAVGEPGGGAGTGVLVLATSKPCSVDGGTLLAAAIDTGAIDLVLPLPPELCSIMLAFNVTAGASFCLTASALAFAVVAAAAWLSANRAAPQLDSAGLLAVSFSPEGTAEGLSLPVRN